MTFVPQIPKKVQFIFNFSLPIVRKLSRKTGSERFVGGRKGYDREFLFMLLLMKKVSNWDYRTIASMAGICHSTLVRANSFFLEGYSEKAYITRELLLNVHSPCLRESFIWEKRRHGEYLLLQKMYTYP